jgi:hypothetical protein
MQVFSNVNAEKKLHHSQPPNMHSQTPIRSVAAKTSKIFLRIKMQMLSYCLSRL